LIYPEIISPIQIEKKEKNVRNKQEKSFSILVIYFYCSICCILSTEKESFVIKISKEGKRKYIYPIV